METGIHNVSGHEKSIGEYIVEFQNGGRLNKVDIVDVDFGSADKVKLDCLGGRCNGGGSLFKQQRYQSAYGWDGRDESVT